MIEKTLLIIKPDIIKKKIIGEIISFLEKNNIEIIYIHMLRLDIETVKDFYQIHSKKIFFNELVEFMTADRIVMLILKGEDIINKTRNLVGNTNFEKAEDNTIRKKFATNLTKNAVHASDSKESFLKEKKILFEFIKNEYRFQ